MINKSPTNLRLTASQHWTFPKFSSARTILEEAHHCIIERPFEIIAVHRSTEYNSPIPELQTFYQMSASQPLVNSIDASDLAIQYTPISFPQIVNKASH